MISLRVLLFIFIISSVDFLVTTVMNNMSEKKTKMCNSLESHQTRLLTHNMLHAMEWCLCLIFNRGLSLPPKLVSVLFNL